MWCLYKTCFPSFFCIFCIYYSALIWCPFSFLYLMPAELLLFFLFFFFPQLYLVFLNLMLMILPLPDACISCFSGINYISLMWCLFIHFFWQFCCLNLMLKTAASIKKKTYFFYLTWCLHICIHIPDFISYSFICYSLYLMPAAYCSRENTG